MYVDVSNMDVNIDVNGTAQLKDARRSRKWIKLRRLNSSQFSVCKDDVGLWDFEHLRQRRDEFKCDLQGCLWMIGKFWKLSIFNESLSYFKRTA